MPGLSTPKQENPFDFVQSLDGDRQYRVPSIAAVDKQIKVLLRQIAAAGEFPKRQEAFREDINLLLDRRSFLLLAQGSPAK